MRSKRILLITPAFPPELGGVQNYLSNFCKNSRNKIYVISKKTKGSKDFDRKQIFKIERTRVQFHLSATLKVVSKIFKKQKIELLCIGHPSLLHIGYFAKKIFGIKYVVFIFGGEYLDFPFSKFYKPIIRRSLRNADSIITISKWLKQDLMKLGASGNRIKIVHPGVELERFIKFKKFDMVEDLGRKHNLHDKKIILTVARLLSRKGHRNVIHALPKILKKVPNTVYISVGGPEDKMEQLRAFAKRIGVIDNTIFVGDQRGDDYVSYHYLSDIFVMLSQYSKEKGFIEGFGIVFLDANACGKPVIGTNVGGIPDAIKDGVTGFLVDSNDENDFVDKCVRLLRSKKLRNKMGKEGIRWAKQHDWKKIVAQIDEIINNL